MRFAAGIAVLWTASCGYVGDPLPPALHIPQPVRDLSAEQVGESVVFRFTIPAKTTEELAVKDLSAVDLRLGRPPTGAWDIEVWAAGARAVEVSTKEPGAAEATAPVGALADGDAVAAVRLRNAKGRVSGWSNVLRLRLEPPLAKPALRADSAPQGARLEWSGHAGPAIVFRDGQRIGEGSQGSYTDSRAELGKTYSYEVQTIRGAALSERSTAVTLRIEDRFPPAKPQGLAAVPGAGTVELTWNRNMENDVAHYHVLRADGAEFRRVAAVDVPAYTDRDVKSGAAYKYRVTAVDLRNNESGATEEVEIIVP
ncbi:MAG: hypothetical protein FJW30_20475 [Acidobacteria bacterium]|nr:hypothetical protein [Acidobacteriota bacterium]